MEFVFRLDFLGKFIRGQALDQAAQGSGGISALGSVQNISKI